jgi:multidrug efflux pump subunit AcrA (membrane-fusion protein)
VVKLTISLDETDPERMRPGMRVRGTVEIDRREDATLIPMSAVFPDEDRHVVYRRFLGTWRRSSVVLGERNTDQVEVLEGLEPGAVLSLEPRS